MADTTQFGHDQLGHILADHLLEVPRFQRSYSWDAGNVEEYLADLALAREKNVDYFMGTVVFARPEKDGHRRQIVDGQQRLATTAILFIAIRDMLREYGKSRQAEEMEKQFLRGYVIAADAEMEYLILGPNDLGCYSDLLDGKLDDIDDSNPLKQCYTACMTHLKGIAKEAKNYPALIGISTQLEKRVQVLVAEATDLPEAYVIFETLNDRGADLTTADLLKNYLFSASRDYFKFVETGWTTLEANFDRPEDLVKFIRYEFVSRCGPISSRKLYRAIQADVGDTAKDIRRYIETLMKAQTVYLAVRDPESSFWGEVSVDVQDALRAYRRFGFEASIPVIIAAFQKWQKAKAAKLLVKLATWSVRAQIAGRIGGGVAEEAFGDAARQITEGTAHNQTKVREVLARLIPNDPEFRAAFTGYGDVSIARAKYLLAMLEKADDEINGRAERALEWYSRSVTIEHVLPESEKNGSDANAAAVNRLGNMALLEKRLNRLAGNKPFSEKRTVYKDSDYVLTKKLARKQSWKAASVQARTNDLADLACRAWPAT